MVREHPDDFLYRRDLAQSVINLGNWYGDDGQAERAEGSYGRAVTNLNRLVQHAPDLARPPTNLPVTPFALDPARIRFDLSYAYYDLAKLLRDGGRSTPAAEAFDQALEHLGRLVREQPGRGSVRHLLAKTHYDLGLQHQADGQIARAAADWIRSREMLEALVREHPETWGYQYNLALNFRSLSLHADATRRGGRTRPRRSAGPAGRSRSG